MTLPDQSIGICTGEELDVAVIDTYGLFRLAGIVQQIYYCFYHG